VAFPNSVAGGRDDRSGSVASSIAKLALGSVNGLFNLNAELTASKGRQGEGAPAPRVVTQNNVQARITRGRHARRPSRQCRRLA
jgi:type II secretory pathway component HofQ